MKEAHRRDREDPRQQQRHFLHETARKTEHRAAADERQHNDIQSRQTSHSPCANRARASGQRVRRAGRNPSPPSRRTLSCPSAPNTANNPPSPPTGGAARHTPPHPPHP